MAARSPIGLGRNRQFPPHQFGHRAQVFHVAGAAKSCAVGSHSHSAGKNSEGVTKPDTARILSNTAAIRMRWNLLPLRR